MPSPYPLPEILQAKISKSRGPTIMKPQSPYIHEKLDLTFGVEFEFVVRIKTETYLPAALQLQSTVGNDERSTMSIWPQCLLKAVQHHMMRVLHSHEVLVNDIYFSPATSRWTLIPCPDGRSFMFDETCSMSAHHEDAAQGHARFNRWTVTTDGTIDFRNPQGIPLGADETDIPIELNTRKMQLNPASLQEVSQVLQLLTSQFSIRTNASTGLHVHIGNAAGTPGQPFWLSTLKNLASLVTVCDPIIEQMHPPWRIGNEACVSPLDCGFEDAHAHELLLMDEINWLPTISNLASFMAGAVGEGRSILDGTPWYAYNFLQTCDGGYGTVEFRQHEGTVEFHRVEAWVLFCAGLVRWASKAYLLGVPQLVERAFGNGNKGGEGMDVTGLLRELGLDELVPYYQTRLWAHEDADDADDGDDDDNDDNNDDGGDRSNNETGLEPAIMNMILREGHESGEWIPSVLLE
ncbi:MAG: hypothetical protein M1812_005223 [Candelaria pacifica]|nr:MAG: hypothetical protein M1812_005223 [Candelaria pacifica]